VGNVELVVQLTAEVAKKFGYYGCYDRFWDESTCTALATRLDILNNHATAGHLTPGTFAAFEAASVTRSRFRGADQ
jgi:hypothetical protein